MNVKYDCIECLAKQSVTLAKKLTDDPTKREQIIAYGLEKLSQNAFTQTPPYITGQVYAYARALTGVHDPFEVEKKEYNTIAHKIIDSMSLRQMILDSEDAFDTAVRLSIAGNIIDFSVGYDIDESTVENSVTLSLTSDLHGVTTEAFKRAVESSKNILFLSDNSGEIVFDQLLISLMPKRKVIYAVKGGPIVNDATMEDAIAVKMDQMVPVVSTGSSIQGTILEDCSEDFKKLFDKADLIISKGQANFETLNHSDKKIFFMLRAKCQCIADEIGCQKNDFVLIN